MDCFQRVFALDPRLSIFGSFFDVYPQDQETIFFCGHASKNTQRSVFLVFLSKSEKIVWNFVMLTAELIRKGNAIGKRVVNAQGEAPIVEGDRL